MAAQAYTFYKALGLCDGCPGLYILQSFRTLSWLPRLIHFTKLKDFVMAAQAYTFYKALGLCDGCPGLYILQSFRTLSWVPRFIHFTKL